MAGKLTIQSVMSIWNETCIRYVSNFRYPVIDPKKFTLLTSVLEKEQIDPVEYFQWYFGILEPKRRPPQPNFLASPIMIAKYRYNRYG